jgi:hypothetical protein
MDELRLGKEALEQAELSVEGVDNHERTCGVVEAHLLDEFAHRYHQQQVENADRQRQVDEDLGRLLNPGGRTDRLRDRIRHLENDNRQQGMVLRLQDEVLHQQSTDIRDLWETLTELRREMERRMQAAPAPDPEPVPEPAPYPRQPEPRDRTPVRPQPVDARALLQIKPPPKFSGTDRRTTFRDWWMQVEEFLDSQPEEVIGGERRRIVSVSRLLEKEAQEWYLEWKRRVRNGQAEHNWQSFVNELRQRFTDDNEADLAYRELETMTYQRDNYTFLIRWDTLCARAGVSGVAYRKMLLSAIGPTLRDRLERYDRANTDKEFRANVLNAGRNLEDWARERRREDRQRPVRASETPRPAPAPTFRPTPSARPVPRS